MEEARYEQQQQQQGSVQKYLRSIPPSPSSLGYLRGNNITSESNGQNSPSRAAWFSSYGRYGELATPGEYNMGNASPGYVSRTLSPGPMPGSLRFNEERLNWTPHASPVPSRAASVNGGENNRQTLTNDAQHLVRKINNNAASVALSVSELGPTTMGEYRPLPNRVTPEQMYAMRKARTSPQLNDSEQTVHGLSYTASNEKAPESVEYPPNPYRPHPAKVLFSSSDSNNNNNNNSSKPHGVAATIEVAGESGATLDNGNVNKMTDSLEPLSPSKGPTQLEQLPTVGCIASPRPPPGEEYDRYGFSTDGLTRDEFNHELKYLATERENQRQVKWLEMMSDWKTWNTKRQSKLRQRISKGIPDAVRGEAWQLLADSKSLALRFVGVFDRLAAAANEEETERAIIKDLHRTFPKHADYRVVEQGLVPGLHAADNTVVVSPSQMSLYRILHAFSVHDPEIGYCQGMGFIAATLLLYMTDEEAFWLLTRIVSGYNMRGLFLPTMPYFSQYCYQFARLLESFMPQLFMHFRENHVHPPLYAAQWFLTLYTSMAPKPVPFDIVLRVWDEFIAGKGKWKFVFKTGLAILYRSKEQLMRMDFEQIVMYLQDIPKHVFIPVDSFIKTAHKMPVTSQRLAELAEDYREELALGNITAFGPINPRKK